jgi:hypothetical protein
LGKRDGSGALADPLESETAWLGRYIFVTRAFAEFAGTCSS